MGAGKNYGLCGALIVAFISLLICFEVDSKIVISSLLMFGERTGIYNGWPLYARFADKLGNTPNLGLTPAMWGDRPWLYEYSQLPDLSHKIAIVTGANSGVGFWTSLHLARKGAHVLLCCRSVSKCSQAVERIKMNSTSASVEPAIMDLSSLASVRAFAKDFLSKHKRLDILVANGGIVSTSTGLTKDNIDPVFATNHVAHQLLYMLLEKTIIATGVAEGDARVVVVSSISSFFSYGDAVALTREDLNKRYAMEMKKDDFFPMPYQQSKVANVLFAQEVARRVAGKPVYANSLHPGSVATEIWGSFVKENAATEGKPAQNILKTLFSKAMWASEEAQEKMWTAEEGALTQVYLAAASDVKDRDIRGRYFHPQALEVMPSYRHCHNLTLQKALWSFTEELIEGRG